MEPLILFGAADRHNFGDLLLARIAEAEAGGGENARPVIHAGLANRDLTAYGGPRVVALGELARDWSARHDAGPADLQHIGGEILDCDAWSAAVMLCDDAAAAAAIRRFDGRPEAVVWAAERLGSSRPAPYVADRGLFATAGAWTVRAAGGVGLAKRETSFRQAVGDALRDMARITVRDATTRAALAALGIDAGLEADPVLRVHDLFAEEIAARRRESALAAVAAAFPGGYVAVQFAAEFGDDASLRRVAAEIARWPASLGVVFFRAGAAPWHDRTEVYGRLLHHFLRAPSGATDSSPCRSARLFESLHIFDIVGLIAGARCVLATSLHAGIVATASGVPFAPLDLGGSAAAKWQAWQATWPELAVPRGARELAGR